MKVKTKNFKETSRNLFLKYTLIPMAGIMIIFIAFFLILSKINVVINSRNVSSAIESSVISIFKDYYNELDDISSSSNVKNYLYTRNDSAAVFDELYKFNNEERVKSIIHIIDADGNFLISTIDSDTNIRRSLTKNILSNLKKDPSAAIGKVNFFEYQYDKSTVYTFAKAITDNGHTIGYVICQPLEEDMQKLLFVQNSEVALITDYHNRVIVSSNNSLIGLMHKFTPQYINSAKNKVSFANGRYYINRNEIPQFSLYVYSLNSLEIKNELIIFISIFVIIMILSIYLLMNNLADKVSAKNSESIDKLIFSIKELKKGNLNSHVNIHSGDEFDTLADEYNIMLDALNKLTEKNKELSKLHYMSEVKLLQSQFNPHFIFNVLETLRYSLIIDPDGAQEIIIELSRFLRYSINYSNEKVHLEDDIKYIEYYLDLCKFRFKDRLKYNISIDSKVKNAYIPKLLLQGLVENSIKYGYKCRQNLEIGINCDYNNGNLILKITDDGGGFQKGKLEEMLEILKNPENHSIHIGLHNVYRRLVLMYGDKQSFKINSIEGIGTTIEINIPFEEDNANV